MEKFVQNLAALLKVKTIVTLVVIAVFAVLAFVSMNLFKYVTVENKLKRFLLYSLTSLSVATLTELIQLLMPSRNAGVGDVLVDMLGFYFGTLAVLVFRCAARRFLPKMLDRAKAKFSCSEK